MDGRSLIATSEHNEVKSLEGLLQTAISHAFTAVTLFTRSTVRAGEALLQAIETLEAIEIKSKNLAPAAKCLPCRRTSGAASCDEFCSEFLPIVARPFSSNPWIG